MDNLVTARAFNQHMADLHMPQACKVLEERVEVMVREGGASWSVTDHGRVFLKEGSGGEEKEEGDEGGGDEVWHQRAGRTQVFSMLLLWALLILLLWAVV
jgi:hypothetical protein